MTRQTVLLSALGAVLVVALWWLFLFSPGQDQLARVEAEREAAEDEQVSLQTRVAALEAVRARAPETEAAIARLRSIIPDDPDLPGALRQVAAAAEDAGMTIGSLTSNRPQAQDEGVGLYSQTLSMAAEGSYFQLVDFLRRLEDPTVTSRGILIDSISVTTGEYPALVMTLQGSMFATLPPVPTPQDAAAPAAPADGAADGAADDEADTGDDA